MAGEETDKSLIEFAIYTKAYDAAFVEGAEARARGAPFEDAPRTGDSGGATTDGWIDGWCDAEMEISLKIALIEECARRMWAESDTVGEGPRWEDVADGIKTIFREDAAKQYGIDGS